MGRRSWRSLWDMPPLGRRPASRAAALTALVSVALLAGCTEDRAAPPPAPPTTVPLEEIDLASVAVGRDPFCDLLDESSVADALGGEPRRTDGWETGDRRRVGGTRDVVHETGCSFRRGRTEATAWVFTPPVTRADARRLVEQRRTRRACEAAGELRFGRPGTVQLCAQGGTRLVTMAGLFGDAWLTCEVSTPGRGTGTDALEGAQRWCVEVVYAAGPA